jgi:predicted branched-subunit amino acid permease
MATSTTKSAYWRGFKAALPFVIVVAPFAMLFGVLATEAGMPLAQVMAFSLVVVAGASQFTALQFMSDNAPILVILASALAVNMRMAMYSAAITPDLGKQTLRNRMIIGYFLVDQSYNLCANEFEKRPDQSLADKTAFFAGSVTPIVPLWYLFTLIGALLGEAIPTSWGLDFIVPIAFLAMVAPALRTFAHIAAAFVSIVLALALWWLPFNLGLLIAALCAMMVGAEIERRTA